VIGGKLKLYDKLEMLVTRSTNRFGSREMVNSVNGYGPLWFLVGEGESEIFPKTNVSDFCKPGLFQQRTP